MVFARTLQVKRFVGLKITLYPSDTVSPIILAMPTTDRTVSCLRWCQETAPLTLPEKNKNPLKMEFSLLHYIFFFFCKTCRSAWLRQLGKIHYIPKISLLSKPLCFKSSAYIYNYKTYSASEYMLGKDRIDESRFFYSVNEALKPTENVSW